jgi:TRAP-type C4-dicarboxylate transport system permease small subunit
MQFMPMVRWLYRRAENILALMMGVMFVAFIAQIIFRYFLNFPIGWTSELSVIMWLWMVLWGAAFVIREDEEIRFDLLFWMVPPGARRVMLIVGGLVLIGLYVFSLPAVVDYVTFMKVQSTAYLKIRFDWLFSIYVFFAVAVICRYAFLVWRAIRGGETRDADPTEASSGL